MTSFAIAFHRERPIDARALRVLYNSVDWWPERQEEEIAQVLSNDLAIGAWDKNQLIGFARVVSDQCFHAYIEDVVVHPDYQHKGIGNLLLRALLEKLQHIETITLFCQTELIPFYEQLGFRAFPSQQIMHQKGALYYRHTSET